MRKINEIAIVNESIESNLRQLGYSSSICEYLRKKEGLIKVNEVSKRIIDYVNKGDVISLIFEDLECREIPEYKLDLEIIYEDDDIIVINKPKGLAVISTKEHYGKSLENALAYYFKKPFIYRPVNRLDKDTSGLMIVAKNQLSHSRMAKEHIHREYLALCVGKMQGEGCIEEPIDRDTNSIIKRKVIKTGKYSKTNYKVLKNYSDYTLVKFVLETGRTHQIRVHSAFIGHPLVGDSLYGDGKEKTILEDGYVLQGQALHSAVLKFNHPISGEKLEFISRPSFVSIDTKLENLI